MRHKILKNAAVEINCEMRSTVSLKSVFLLINLQKNEQRNKYATNVFRINSRQAVWKARETR